MRHQYYWLNAESDAVMLRLTLALISFGRDKQLVPGGWVGMRGKHACLPACLACLGKEVAKNEVHRFNKVYLTGTRCSSLAGKSIDIFGRSTYGGVLNCLIHVVAWNGGRVRRHFGCI